LNWSDLKEGDVVLTDLCLPVLLILRASAAGRVAYVDLTTGRTSESKSDLGEMLSFWTVLKRAAA